MAWEWNTNFPNGWSSINWGNQYNVNTSNLGDGLGVNFVSGNRWGAGGEVRFNLLSPAPPVTNVKYIRHDFFVPSNAPYLLPQGNSQARHVRNMGFGSLKGTSNYGQIPSGGESSIGDYWMMRIVANHAISNYWYANNQPNYNQGVLFPSGGAWLSLYAYVAAANGETFNTGSQVNPTWGIELFVINDATGQLINLTANSWVSMVTKITMHTGTSTNGRLDIWVNLNNGNGWIVCRPYTNIRFNNGATPSPTDFVLTSNIISGHDTTNGTNTSPYAWRQDLRRWAIGDEMLLNDWLDTGEPTTPEPPPPGGQLTPAVVQTKSAAPGGNVTSLAATFDTNVTAGNLLVACIGAGNRTDWVITDNRGNTWTKVRDGAAGGTTRYGAMWYCWNAVAGATTVTASTVSLAADISLVIREFSGVDAAANPLNVHMGRTYTDSVTALTSDATAQPATGNVLVVGQAVTADRTYSNLGSFGSLVSQKAFGNTRTGIANFSGTNLGPQAFGITASSNTDGWMGVAVFRAASGAPALPPAPVASFTVTPAAPVVGQSVTFNGSASTGDQITYVWDDFHPTLGSFAWGTGSIHTRTFNTPGIKYARLTVTDQYGQTHSLIQEVEVFDSAPPPPEEPVVAPKFATLFDDFDGSALSNKWSVTASGAFVDAGKLNLPNTTASTAVRTSQLYDLAGSSVAIELVNSLAGGTLASSQLNFSLESGDNYARFALSDNILYMQVSVNSGATRVYNTSIPFSLVTHKYLRIRNVSGSVLLWETSPDNTTWTQRGSYTVPFAITALYLTLRGLNWGTATTSNWLVERVNQTSGAPPVPVGTRKAHIGTGQVSKAYIGTNAVAKVYLGTNLIVD
jgi:hypothetical protein